MVALSCQNLAGYRLEPPRVKARYGKPSGAGEIDVSECKVGVVSTGRVGRRTMKEKVKES